MAKDPEQKRRHRGRPTAEATPGEKATLGLRVSAAFKDHLQRLAWLNDRPLSQEAEFRLEQSFHRQSLLPDVLSLAYGRDLAGILMAVAAAMVEAGREATFDRPRREGHHWIRDPYAFQQATFAAVEMLEWFRPAGEPIPDGDQRYRDEPPVAYRLQMLLKNEPCGYDMDFVGHPTRQIQELLAERLDQLPTPTVGKAQSGTAPKVPADAMRHSGAPSPELANRLRADREAVEREVQDYIRVVEDRRAVEKQHEDVKLRLFMLQKRERALARALELRLNKPGEDDGNEG